MNLSTGGMVARIDPQPGVEYAGIVGGKFYGEDAGVQPVPADMQPSVIGVYVGGCVKTGLGSLGGNAHAHAFEDDSHRGWVCFQHPDNLKNERTRMHELAHIRTGHGHTDKWRAEMARLGQPIAPCDRRRTRKKRS